MASLLALLRGSKGAFIMLFVVTPMAVSLYVSSSRKQRGPVGDDRDMVGKVKDHSAYRRSMDARMVMDYDGEFDSTDSVAKYESSGKELAFDGVAPAKPDWLKGVLRPQDSKKAASAMPLSDSQLNQGLNSVRHAGVVSNRKSASMSPAGVAVDPAAPVEGGAGVAAGSAVGPGAAVGPAGAGVAAGSGVAGSDPVQMVTGGAGMQKAVNAGLDVVSNSMEQTMKANSITDNKSRTPGMSRGGKMQDLLKAKTEADLFDLGSSLSGTNTQAILQLTFARAFSVSASEQPEGCASGNCPVATSKDAAGVIFDGSRLSGGGGGSGVAVSGDDVGTLRAKANKRETDVDSCATSTEEKGLLEAQAEKQTAADMKAFEEKAIKDTHALHIAEIEAKTKEIIARKECLACYARGKYECCHYGLGECDCCHEWPCREPMRAAWLNAEKAWKDAVTACEKNIMNTCQAQEAKKVHSQCVTAVVPSEEIDKACKEVGGTTIAGVLQDKCDDWLDDMNLFCKKPHEDEPSDEMGIGTCP